MHHHELRRWMTLMEAFDPATYWTTDTINWWTSYLRSMEFDSPEKARDWVFRYLERQDRQSTAQVFGAYGTEKNRGIADSIPLFKAGRKIKVGTKPKVSRAKQPKIGTMEPEGTAPDDVDWHKQDLQDSVRHVTATSIIQDYVPEKERERVTVYPAYVPSSEVPDEVCVEEHCDDEEDSASYDWDQFSFRGSFPPAKLSVDRHGKIHILDGNHRIRHWRSDRGYEYIPAWVIDYRRVKND